MITKVKTRPNILLYGLLTTFLLFGVAMGNAFAEVQSVVLTPSTATPEVGESFSVTATYDVDTGDNTLTGLGIRIHFDSTKLTFDDWLFDFPTGQAGKQGPEAEDADDGDPATDQVLKIAWLDFIGGSWPNEALPLDLATIGFTASGSSGPTNINVTFISTAVGYSGDSTSAAIDIQPGPLAVLTVAPDTATLTADDTQQFTVTGTDAGGNPVMDLGVITWSVNGGIGTIDANGLFDATTVGTGSVTATSSLGPADTSGAVNVSAGALFSITVSPDTATLTADENQAFSVTGADQDGNPVAAVGIITWSGGAGIGTIDPVSGIFDATTVGTGTVTATSDLGPTDDSGTITVTAGVVVAITVDPDTATLTADQTQQFTVSGVDSDGNPADVGTITWSGGAGIGTIDPASGLFDATTVGTGTVTATSSFGPTDDSGNIEVTPGVLAVLTVDPDTANLTADDTQAFTVTGADADGNAAAIGTITWSVNGGIGTIDGAGLFDATTVGTGSVTATSDIGGVNDTSGDVVVSPGNAASILLASDKDKVPSDAKGSANLTATVLDADGNVKTDLPATPITFTVSGDGANYDGWTGNTESADTINGVASVVFTTAAGQVPDPPGSATADIVADGAGLTSNTINIDIVNFSATADFTELVTSGTPNQAVITAIGATNYNWSIVSGPGALSAATGNPVTFTAPATIAGGTNGDETVVQVEDADNAGVTFQLTLTTFDPVVVTDPTTPVGITNGGAFDTFQITQTGGDGNYSYQVNSAGGTADVSATGLVTGTGAGDLTVYVWDSNGSAGGANSFSAETATITVVDPIVVTGTAAFQEGDPAFTFMGTGGSDAPNYVWSISNAAAGTIDAATGEFTPAASVTQTENANITATDPNFSNIFTDYPIAVFQGVTFPDPPAEIPIVEPGDAYPTLTPVGGSGFYEFQVTVDPSGTFPAMWTESADYDFIAPDTGPFAGLYEITVRDRDNPDFTATFEIKVPLEIDPASLVMLEGDPDVPITVLGAPAGTGFTFALLEETSGTDVTADPDYGALALGFGVAGAQDFIYSPVADISDDMIKSFTIEFVADDPDLIAAGLETIESGIYRVTPTAVFSGFIVDDTDVGVSGAEVAIIEPSAYMTGTTTAGDGSFTFDVLPDTGIIYQFLVTAAGYLDAYFASTDLASDGSTRIPLTTADPGAYIGGTITDVGGPTIADIYVYYDDGAGNDVLAGATRCGPTGVYQIDLAADPGAGEYTIVAMSPGFFGSTTVAHGLPIDPPEGNVVMAATGMTVDARYGGIGSLQVGPGQVPAVQVPAGAVATAGPPPITDITFTVDQNVPNPDQTALNTQNSGDFLYQITAVDNNGDPVTTFLEPILVTVPFDLASVAPGDFENGTAVIRHADTVADLVAGTGIKTVAAADIVAVDYVGDGVTGWVTFEVNSLSFFGIGGGVFGGGGGGCFIDTAVSGMFTVKAAVLPVVMLIGLTALVIRRKR